MSKSEITFTISPLSLPALAVGLFIQTCYGWHEPTTVMQLVWMLFHIFVAPTLLAIVVWLGVITIPAIIIGAVGFVAMMIEFFRTRG